MHTLVRLGKQCHALMCLLFARVCVEVGGATRAFRRSSGGEGACVGVGSRSVWSVHCCSTQTCPLLTLTSRSMFRMSFAQCSGCQFDTWQCPIWSMQWATDLQPEVVQPTAPIDQFDRQADRQPGDKKHAERAQPVHCHPHRAQRNGQYCVSNAQHSASSVLHVRKRKIYLRSMLVPSMLIYDVRAA